jgi:hypothetical protein
MKVKRKDGWHLYSRDGRKHLGGPYKSEAGVNRRERQVRYWKAKKR